MLVNVCNVCLSLVVVLTHILPILFAWKPTSCVVWMSAYADTSLMRTSPIYNRKYFEVYVSTVCEFSAEMVPDLVYVMRHTDIELDA